MPDNFSPDALREQIKRLPDSLPAEEVRIGFAATQAEGAGVEATESKTLGKGWAVGGKQAWYSRAGWSVAGWLGWKGKQ